jgi:hypothetical protein
MDVLWPVGSLPIHQINVITRILECIASPGGMLLSPRALPQDKRERFLGISRSLQPVRFALDFVQNAAKLIAPIELASESKDSTDGFWSEQLPE